VSDSTASHDAGVSREDDAWTRSSIGAQIREGREQRGLTLKSLAEAVGVTPSLLSQVENDKAQPSLGTLRRVAAYLNLSADALLGLGDLARPNRQQVVHRRSENSALTVVGGARWERLGGSIDGVLEILRVTYPPQSSSAPAQERLRFAGSEFGVLLTGTLTLNLGFESMTMGPGDSVHFDTAEPHAYENGSDETAEGIWFIVRDPEISARVLAGLAATAPSPSAGPALSAVLGALQREGW